MKRVNAKDYFLYKGLDDIDELVVGDIISIAVDNLNDKKRYALKYDGISHVINGDSLQAFTGFIDDEYGEPLYTGDYFEDTSDGEIYKIITMSDGSYLAITYKNSVPLSFFLDINVIKRKNLYVPELENRNTIFI